ncbi:phage portal protein [Mesorhizobium sp. ESP7-2]|nr:phage portal protein [Mesorhizobium sp. ESP7-2]
MPLIREPFAGAWQRNAPPVDRTTVQSHPTVFACQTLIAGDIGKLGLRLIGLDPSGVWIETARGAYSPVLRKPNSFQTRQQFVETWVLSKLQHGNTLVLKQRDGRGVVVAMYVLDWNRVQPLVADDGSVFYRLATDRISGLPGEVIVPAREVIHDRWNTLYHPLIGISPVFAAGAPAMQGMSIAANATNFFQNGAMPGGILTIPGSIDQPSAERLKAEWSQRFTGPNAGKTAILSNGMKYEAFSVNAVDAQLIEQLKWTSEQIAAVYHVPGWLVQVGAAPTYNNIETMLTAYYSQCLQGLIEAIEALLDEGLGLGDSLGVEFDLDGLLRTDTLARMDALDKAKGKLTVNEMRFKLNQPPITGGNTVFLQEQDHGLEWLARRDALPLAPQAPPPPPPAPVADPQAEKRLDARLGELQERLVAVAQLDASATSGLELRIAELETKLEAAARPANPPPASIVMARTIRRRLMEYRQ